MSDIHLLMAVHNRRRLTVQALTHFEVSARGTAVSWDATVYDDGSTDGTVDAIRSLGLPVHVLQGSGCEYWARSMALAETAALAQMDIADEAFLFWLNDDVALDEDAIDRLLRVAHDHPGGVVVGATRDPASRVVTYSGMRRRGSHPLAFQAVLPSDSVQLVDTFNGNVVLVPAKVAVAMGGIDGAFRHGLADIDYGMRCRKAGIEVLLGTGTFGTCPRNPPQSYGSRLVRWRAFVGRKGGGNPRSMVRYLRKHSRGPWILYLGGTYILWWLRDLLSRGGAR